MKHNDQRYFNLLSRYKLVKKSHGSELWRHPKSLENEFRKLPAQGFKVHVSLAHHNATSKLREIIPHLINHRVPFKLARSLDAVKKLNTGRYGFLQVGKIVTIYPKDKKYFLDIVNSLKNCLRGAIGPVIPSDNKVPGTSNVFYRYGILNSRVAPQLEGNAMIEAPDGTLETDTRMPNQAVPHWEKDPFENCETNSKNYRMFANRAVLTDVIRQRAKGGVYAGIWFGENYKPGTKPRPIVLKEARKCGEAESRKIDAITRLKWQETVLKNMRKSQFVPEVISSFPYDGNYYLAMEKINAIPLDRIFRQKAILPRSVLSIVRNNTIRLVREFHRNQWYICDISPDNILVNDDGEVFVTDLECCWNEKFPIVSTYGSKGYFQNIAQTSRPLTRSEAYNRDLYALDKICSKIGDLIALSDS